MFIPSRARYYSPPVVHNQRSFGRICQCQTLHAKQYHLTTLETSVTPPINSANVSTFVILNADKLLYPSRQIRGVCFGHVTASSHRSRLCRCYTRLCLETIRHVRANEKSCFPETDKMMNMESFFKFLLVFNNISSRVEYSYFFFLFLFFFSQGAIKILRHSPKKMRWSASFTRKQSRAR